MSKHQTFFGAAFAAAGLATPLEAFADAVELEPGAYVVRPFVQTTDGLVDGLQENAATQGSEIGDGLEGAVDLSDGSIRAQTDIRHPDGFGLSGGVLAERLTFSPNATGTTVGFSFDFDGAIRISDLPSGPLASGYNAIVFADLYVYDAALSVTYDNFTSFGGALIARSYARDFGAAAGETPGAGMFDIDETLSGSIIIEDGKKYDVFASLAIFADTYDNDIRIMMDFLNTGLFGIDKAPGVSFTSLSGVFLTRTAVAPVPVPAALPLLAGALACLGLAARRRRGA